MKKQNILISGKEITLRFIRSEDIGEYYKSGFKSVDKEVKLYTGTRHNPSKEEITFHVNKIIEDESQYDFLIINREGKIIGESVINVSKGLNKCGYIGSDFKP